MSVALTAPLAPESATKAASIAVMTWRAALDMVRTASPLPPPEEKSAMVLAGHSLKPDRIPLTCPHVVSLPMAACMRSDASPSCRCSESLESARRRVVVAACRLGSAYVSQSGCSRGLTASMLGCMYSVLSSMASTTRPLIAESAQ